MASSNRKSGSAWKETRHDKFYHLAKEQGYRSRAAFKLIQLNKKYDFLSGCKSVVDLGAAPGGWLQVCQKYMPVSSLIIGLDLLPIRPIRGVTTLQQDITTEQAKKAIKQELQTWDVDVVLHDGAPNVAGGGSWTKDAYVQNELVIHSLRLATTVLRQGGWFITKVFRSQDYNSLLWVLQQFFKKVEVTKPQASRNASAEIFVVCQGYLAPKKIDAKLLDPNEIFQSFDDVAGGAKKKPDVFSKKEGHKAHRSRQGYDDVNNMTQTKKLSAVDFVSEKLDTTAAIAALGDYNSFTLEPATALTEPDAAKRERHDALLKEIDAHASTTDEVRSLCADLRVLGKGDFKALLKWRQRIQTHLAALEEAAKKADGRWEAEEAERKARELEKAMAIEDAKPQLTAEQSFEQELRELRMKKLLDAKKEKKKREAKAKASKRQLVNAHNLKESAELIGSEAGEGASAAASSAALHSSTAGGTGGEDGLFTLRTIKSKDALDYVAETEGKGSKKRKAAAAAAASAAGDEDEAMSDSDDEDDEDVSDDENDSDEEALYARLLQEQNEAFEEATGRGSKRGGIPRNMYEDQEENLLAKMRARDQRKAGASLSTEAGDISLGNVRGADTEEDYSRKLERDLDYMYETYKERRDIKSKNRTGGSELDMSEEADGNALLEQARKEEKNKLRVQAANKKRKREAGDSDTDSDDDMDRFNSDDAESDTDEDEAEAKAGRRGLSTTADDEEDSDAEEGDNPLIRKLHREEAPSATQRMQRWFDRPLLADADMEDTEQGDEQQQEQQESEDEEEEAPRARNGKGKGKPRNLVMIDAGAASSGSEDDASVGGSSRGGGHSDVSDDDMSDGGDGKASTFFSNGKAVRTKSGLKPNSVLGLDGLRRSTASVAADVISDAPAAAAAAGKKVKRGKDGKPLRPRAEAAVKLDEEGDAIDSLKLAEKKARAAMKKTTKNYKAQDKEREESEKSKRDSFEVVPISAEDEALEHLSSDDDAVAERLALGKHMLAKKSRDALINDSYGRYSLDRQELAQLPEWFVRDEAQHHTPILPVSKAEVDTYKEQLRAINARPIRKIAEAKARKQVKTQKRWEKIKAQAEVIANAEGGQSGDKLRQIEKLFHQKSLKKEKKERVYVVTQKNGKTAMPKSSKDRKGKIVKVDTRMKKDKRGEKKAEQRRNKKKSNKNKKQRKV